jgi:predicted phosphodiesterase
MKIQIASDLHIEFFEGRWENDPTLLYAEGADVLVLAGDIHKGNRGIAAFCEWPVPVVYVHGNHEHYNEHIWKNIDKLRFFSENSQVHYLEKNEWTYQGVRFLGCCLWTDYLLMGDRPGAMRKAASSLNDHRQIETHYRDFRPKDALIIHQESRAWLEEKLSEPFSGKTVVVTHHGVHPNSIAEEYQGKLLNPAFVSDLTPLMGKAALWIHGHVHNSFDYVINGTRVVANPRGYPLNPRSAKSLAEVNWENENYQPQLVIDI